ncbi:MAG: peptide ABC transporter substrate-binding protein [Simkania negevensis]|nr:peptide ABC transporter substrate-binding protein [Simkania negevensis]
MIKKIFTVIILTAGFFLFMTSISLKSPEASSKSSCLRINITAEPHTMHPAESKGIQPQTILRMLFEGLTRIGPQNIPEPALAERIEVSADGLTYFFHLREAAWTNRNRVTADDFVYAWKKALQANASPRIFELYPIKNAKKIHEKTLPLDQLGAFAITPTCLKIELEHLTPYFLQLTASPIYFPIDQKTDEVNPLWAKTLSTYVGNGPFRLVTWNHFNVMEVEKNPTYWDKDQVKLEKIQMVMVNESIAFEMYEKKELDWIGSPLSLIPLGILPSLKSQDALHFQPFFGTYLFYLNVQKFPLQHPLIRKAFAMAIQREEIVEHVTQGKQTPAFRLIPDSMQLEGQYRLKGDMSQAKEYFQKALTELKLSEIEGLKLMYISEERNRLIAQAVQEQWRAALGVDIVLDPVDRKTYFARLASQDFCIAAGYWIADFDDPINFLEAFKSHSNYTSWENEIYKTLLDESLTISDAAQRKKLLRECEDILLEEVPLIPLFHYTLACIKNPNLDHLFISSLGYLDFKWAEFTSPSYAYSKEKK